MKKYSLIGFGVASAILLTVVFNTSCNKPEPCKAVITVYDTLGNIKEAGVTVKLYATVTTSTGTATGDLKAEGITDSEGKVEFTFKLPVIMDIEAQKPGCTIQLPSYDTTTNVYTAGRYCHGKSIIKCEEGKTAEKKVYLKD